MTWEQVTGFVGMMGGIVIAVLSYLRSKKVDAISAQTGAVDSHREGTALVIEGLTKLVDQLQEGGASTRADVDWLTIRLDTCAARLDACITENDSLKRELSALRRKYGENGVTT